jgi:hypothetical protein
MLSYGTLEFSDPVQLTRDVLPFAAGLYAILVPNYEFRPAPYEPIYFGQSANLRAAVGIHHLAYSRWRWHPRGRQGLFVSYVAMPSSTEDWRRYHVTQLLRQYNPVCNRDEHSDAQTQALREIGSRKFGAGDD